MPHSTGYQDIVDGQQRLTTMMILFCVIRDLFPQLNKDVDIATDPNVITISRIKKCICDDDDRKRLKLLTHLDHQNDFEDIILNKVDLEGLKKPSKRKLRSTPQSRFKNTAFIFKQKLLEIGEPETGKLISYLFNRVRIIKIACTNQTFAIKLFQVLNDRGMDLTSSDLIKSLLMSKLPEEKHKQFTSDWAKIEYISQETDLDMDELFTLYEYYHIHSNPKRSLSDEMEDVFKKFENSNQAINDFKKFCVLYKDGIYEARDKTIFSLKYIRWSMYWKTIALTALKEDFLDYQDLMKVLMRFYYLYWMAGKTLTQIKQTSFNVIKYIKEKKDLPFIKEELSKKLDADRILPLVKESLSGEVYYERWIKPLLLMIEYNQTDESFDTFIPMNHNLHVEHILPQKYDSFEEWGHFSDDDAEDVLNSLGNLTLLLGKKNIEASNNPFEAKLNIYKGVGKVGKKKDGLTSFEITKKIISDGNTNWTIEDIHKRHNWYLENIEDILDIDLSEIKK